MNVYTAEVMNVNVEWLMALQDPDFRKAFDIRLKKLRKQKRWSQKELAARWRYVCSN